MKSLHLTLAPLAVLALTACTTTAPTPAPAGADAGRPNGTIVHPDGSRTSLVIPDNP